MSHQSPHKRAWRLLAIIVSTVLLTLLVIELVVRLVPLYPDSFTVADPQRGWRYLPNAAGYWVNVSCIGQVRNWVQLNSHGLHDAEHTYEKPPNTRRILIIGDSVVAAFEAPLERTFFRRLEALLNSAAESDSYEVIAAGHQAYGADLELLYYEQEGYRYDPDVIIVVMQPHNDFRDNLRELRQSNLFDSPYFTLNGAGDLVLHEPPPQEAPSFPMHEFLSRSSRLYQLLRARIEARQARPEYDEETLDRLFDESWPLTFALVDRFRDRVEADGAAFGVVVEQSFLNPPEYRAEMHQRIAEQLDELGVSYISLLSAFDAAERAGAYLRYPCDTHWTPDGHALAAEVIAPFVRELAEG